VPSASAELGDVIGDAMGEILGDELGDTPGLELFFTRERARR
jgi:hypothetical protein